MLQYLSSTGVGTLDKETTGSCTTAKMFNIARWFIYGEVDWDNLQAKMRGISPYLSGAL